jgi:hypothetical protein
MVAAGGCVPTNIHTYIHNIHTYVYVTPASNYPLVIEAFYEIFKVSGQSPNTVDVYGQLC